MRDLSVRVLLAAALICGAAAPAWADYDDGWAAFEDAGVRLLIGEEAPVLGLAPA